MAGTEQERPIEGSGTEGDRLVGVEDIGGGVFQEIANYGLESAIIPMRRR